MGFTLLTIPRGTHLLNQTVASASATSYTPSSRIAGTGLNYTTELAKQTSVYIPPSGSGNSGQVPTQPTDPECDPEIYLQQKNLMFENLLKYMDEYSSYNYLKVTNQNYNTAFISADKTYQLEVNIATNIEKLFYFRLFPDDNEICEDKMELVRAKLAVKDYSLELEVCGCND